MFKVMYKLLNLDLIYYENNLTYNNIMLYRMNLWSQRYLFLFQLCLHFWKTIYSVVPNGRVMSINL